MNFVKKILDLIKNIFKKKKNNKEVIDKYVIKTINWELVNSLKNYDIVYVKMNQSIIDKDSIDKNHQKRPFLITYKSSKNLSGFYLTGNLNRKSFGNSDIKIILNKEKYNLKKNSLVKCDKEVKLPFENVEYFISHLNDYDIEKLNKYKEILKNKTDIYTYIDISDVVKIDDKSYIIYQKDNQQSYGYSISATNKSLRNSNGERNPEIISYKNTNYELNYKDQHIFSNKEKYQVIDCFSIKTKDEIDNNKKLIKKIKNCQKKNQKRPKN